MLNLISCAERRSRYPAGFHRDGECPHITPALGFACSENRPGGEKRLHIFVVPRMGLMGMVGMVLLLLPDRPLRCDGLPGVREAR